MTALAAASNYGTQQQALQGVLFYLAAYGIMNAGAFGVLMLLPARPVRTWSSQTMPVPPATTAETMLRSMRLSGVQSLVIPCSSISIVAVTGTVSTPLALGPVAASHPPLPARAPADGHASAHPLSSRPIG